MNSNNQTRVLFFKWFISFSVLTKDNHSKMFVLRCTCYLTDLSAVLTAANDDDILTDQIVIYEILELLDLRNSLDVDVAQIS